MKDGVAVLSKDAMQVGCFISNWQKVPMGMPVQPEYDTLLHAEQCRFCDDGRLELLDIPVAGQCITPRGSALEVGEKITAQGVKLRPSYLAQLRMGGVEELTVFAKPQITILPVGDELMPAGAYVPEDSLKRAESDSIFLRTTLERLGAEARVAELLPDSCEKIQEAIVRELPKSDLLVIIGGIGKGGEIYNDYALAAVEGLGKVIQHGVLLSPGGSPVLFGVVDGKPVIGLPGPPHAILAMAEPVMAPVLCRYLQAMPEKRPQLRAKLLNEIKGRESLWYFRMRLTRIAGEYWLAPLDRPGDTVETFVDAEALFVIQPGSVCQKGDEVCVELLWGEDKIPER